MVQCNTVYEWGTPAPHGAEYALRFFCPVWFYGPDDSVVFFETLPEVRTYFSDSFSGNEILRFKLYEIDRNTAERFGITVVRRFYKPINEILEQWNVDLEATDHETDKLPGERAN